MGKDVTVHGRRSLTQRAALGVFWTLAGTGGQTVLKLVVLAVLARVLTPTDFGIAGAAIVAITFVSIFAQLGVSQALVQLPDLNRDHLIAGFHLSLIQGLIAGAFIYMTAGYADALFKIDGLATPIRWMSLLLPITSLHQVSEATIQRALRFRILAAEQIVSYGIGYGVVAITLGLMGFGVWALVWGTLAQGVIKAAILVAVSPPIVRPSAQRSAYLSILHFGGGHALAQLGMTCAYQIDNVIVGRFLGAEMLGLYGRAFQVVTMPTKLLGVGLLNVLFPIMSRIKTEPERLSRAFLRSIRAVAIVGLPFSLLTAILAPEIVYILLGRQWEAVVVPFQLLSAAIVFRVGHKVCEALVRACGAVYQLAWTQWVYTVLVALGAYIGHFASLPGVAAGVAIAVALNFLIVFALVASLSYLPLSAIGIVLFRQLVILSGIAAVAIPAIFALRATGISEFFRVAILCSGVFLLYGSLWMFRTRAFGEEGEVFKSIFRQYLPLRTRTGDVA